MYAGCKDYTPTLDLPVLDLPDCSERPDGEISSLQTDPRISPRVFPGAQGISEIGDVPKSLTGWRKQANLCRSRMGVLY